MVSNVGISKTKTPASEENGQMGSTALAVGADTAVPISDTHSATGANTAKKQMFSFIPDRYVMVFLCALCTCINYADRVNMSVAIISMSQTYQFNLKQQSLVLSSFFLGYIPMQIGGAVLCRRFGAKVVLSTGAFMWSIFTILTPFAADFSLSLLLVCRVFMGLAEGVAFPSVYHFLSAWIPSHERGRAVALFLTGAHVGTVAALIISPYIIRVLEWRYIFYIFGSVGFGWIAMWEFLAFDRDEGEASDSVSSKARDPDHETVPLNMEERNSTAAHVTKSSSASGVTVTSTVSTSAAPKLKDDASSSVPAINAFSTNGHHHSNHHLQHNQNSFRIFTRQEWRMIRTILSDRRTLSVCFTQCIFSMVHYVILSWLPTYFKEVFHTDAGSLSFTFIPYAAMAFAANAGGYMSDALIRSGRNITSVRKIVTVVSSVGAAVSLIIFGQMQTIAQSISAAAFSMAFMSMHSGGFESAYLDSASPKSAGIFKAVANTLASFSGFVVVPFSTWVLHMLGGSWRAMFSSLSILHILIMVIFNSTYSAERVLTDDAL